jgi:hypothetical protein
MAAPFTTIPTLGADFNSITTAAQLAAGQVSDARLGTILHGSNGRFYVYAQAGGAIPASTAVATVNATTFAATATGGAYLSPTTAMATGDRGWFSKASV